MGVGWKHQAIINGRMERLEWYGEEERELIHEYDVTRVREAMAVANQNIDKARAILAARYGPPLVPRKGRV